MTSTRTALEQSFADIAEKHRLTNFSIGYWVNPVSEAYRFDSYAHFDDPAPGQHSCASASGATIAETLSAVLAEVHARRTVQPGALADERLPALAKPEGR